MTSRYSIDMNRDRVISPPSKVVGEEAGFHRRAWFDMLARHCFSGQRVMIPEARIGSANVSLLLVEEKDRLSSLSNYYSFSYAPIFEGIEKPEQCEKLTTQIAADLRLSQGRISLYPLIDDDDGMPDMLRQAFAEAGWIAILTLEGSNHIIDVNGRNFAAYWKTRPGALRSLIKRKGAMMRGYEFAIWHTINDTVWNDYRTVYETSWKNAEPYPAMVRAIAEEAVSRGALRMAFLRKQGIPVAAQLWTIEGETACIHKIAHDTSEDTRSPGTLLSHHMFAHMIDIEKVSRIDYGTGDNAYKRDWMERARPMLRLDCFNPSRPRQWLPALKTRISQLVGRASYS